MLKSFPTSNPSATNKISKYKYNDDCQYRAHDNIPVGHARHEGRCGRVAGTSTLSMSLLASLFFFLSSALRCINLLKIRTQCISTFSAIEQHLVVGADISNAYLPAPCSVGICPYRRVNRIIAWGGIPEQ